MEMNGYERYGESGDRWGLVSVEGCDPLAHGQGLYGKEFREPMEWYILSVVDMAKEPSVIHGEPHLKTSIFHHIRRGAWWVGG